MIFYFMQDGLVVENMNDVPYVPARHITPETVAAMTAICTAVRRTVDEHVPCGVQVSERSTRRSAVPKVRVRGTIRRVPQDIREY